MSLEDKPLVSVITPTFNRADFIEQAVGSVLKQTYQNFELFIIDDGSTDDTNERIASALEDPRVHYFYQPNQGQSVARNLALSHAGGRLICFLDSDNYWPEEKLEVQVATLDEHPDVDVVYGDIISVDGRGREISRKNMKRHSGNIAKHMIRDNFVSMNTAMARRRCFDELGVMSGTRRVADDYDLWLRFSARFRFLYMPKFLVFYRIMEDQISSDKSRRFDSNWQIINDFRREFASAMSKKDFDSGFAAFHCRKARYLASQNSKRRALVEIMKALKLEPVGRSTWRSLAAVLLK